MNPEYPIYIVSRGRWEKTKRLTSRSLEHINVPYFIAVEEYEYEKYASVIDSDKILIVPDKYTIDYDACDDLGLTKSKGPGAARNFCWDHSIELGANHHWVLDDNIAHFYRLNRNTRIRVESGTIFKCCEDFVNRYENIAISGMNYRFFCEPTCSVPPYYLNTRVYSCLLIRNDIPYRWRGRYNEDTDICLRVLKDGWCTILFNAFLCGKVGTQSISGGNTDTFYAVEGTYNKSKMLKDLHSDVTRLVWRYNRPHHYVDYSIFKKNKLIRKKDLEIADRVNNYGMKLIDLNAKL